MSGAMFSCILSILPLRLTIQSKCRPWPGRGPLYARASRVRLVPPEEKGFRGWAPGPAGWPFLAKF